MIDRILTGGFIELAPWRATDQKAGASEGNWDAASAIPAFYFAEL